VIVPVFKTGGRRVNPSPVGSTPTRFRQLFENDQDDFLGRVTSSVDKEVAEKSVLADTNCDHGGLKPGTILKDLRGAGSAALPRYCMHS